MSLPVNLVVVVVVGAPSIYIDINCGALLLQKNAKF